MLIFEIIQLHATVWPVAVAASCGLFSVGLVLGFLFSIPKAATDPTTPRAVAPQRADHDGPKEADNSHTASSSHRLLNVNTNFEQISDWLTKIIVGVGLVEVKQLVIYGQGFVAFLAGGLAIGNQPLGLGSAQVLAVAMVLCFPSLGMLVAYLYTRLYVARAIYESDLYSTSGVESQVSRVLQAIVAPSGPQAVGSGEDVTASGAPAPVASAPVRQAARQIASLPLDRLTTSDDLVAWCRAQVALGDYVQAVKGYSQLVERTPDDPQLRLEYANALYNLGRNSEVIQQLQLARRSIRPDTPLEIRRAIAESLMNAYLYSDPPEGLTRRSESVRNTWWETARIARTRGSFSQRLMGSGMLT